MILAPTLAAASVLAATFAARLGREGPTPSYPRALGRILERRDERAIARDLPAFLEAVARAIRAGFSIRAALAESAPGIEVVLGRDVHRLLAELDDGLSLAEALDQWCVTRERVAGVRLTASALALAAASGGQIARTVDGVADTLRGEVELADEVRSLGAQAEASATLIAVLPLVFGLVAGVTDPETVRFLTTPPVGPVCLGFGVALDAAGFVWLRRITRGIR